MKLIKQLLLVLLVSTLSLSCSSDDSTPYSIPDPNTETPGVTDPEPEPEPEQKDIMIGTWNINELYLNDYALLLNDCEKQATITFNEDGTLKEHIVEYDCAVREGEFTGTWKNLEDNKYQIRVDKLSNNGYFNDVDYSTLEVIEEGKIKLTQQIQHEGENSYILSVELLKK
ncbi:lipocalin family protein [Myroides sp. LoEW2-1]|uniref:lipocalin family protein n=1 Tax=Myroides sp. LoEW2-1 TaxID=2683192 RepID=UPI00132383B4|nr:lipocalin family protein [Myroides sp. LoEW2-1]MVX37094.1 hypothetical protein [Myroides sp. LoEW2-1]